MKKTNLLKISALTLAFALTACGGTSENGGNGQDNQGGFDTSRRISLYSRAAGSGTRECFFETIKYKEVAKEDKWESGVTVSTKGANSELMSAIANDEYGIGYCSLDSLSSVSGIKGLKYEGVEATKENVLNESYKLKRNFNYVIRDYSGATDTSAKEAVEGFIAFLTTTREGQAVISSKGGIIQNNPNLVTFSSIIDNYPVFKSDKKLLLIFVDLQVLNQLSKQQLKKLKL